LTRGSGRAALLLGAVLLARAAAAQEPSPSVPPNPYRDRPLAAIEITGHTRIGTESIQETLGVKPGRPLRRDPAGLPRLLESHYHTLGYPAARVQVRYDETAQVLYVAVDEGQVARLDLVGVAPGEQARVRAILDVKPGAPFSDEELSDGLRRLLDDTHGAYESEGDPPYTVERVDGGVRVELHLRRQPAAFQVRPGGTGRAPWYSRVDGLAPGASVGALFFTPSTFNPVETYAEANFGFASERVSYDLGARRVFGARGLLALGYEHHDFTDNNDGFRALGVEYLKGLHVFFSVFQDFYRRRGDEAYAAVRVSPHVLLGANYRRDRYQSLPVVSDGNLLLSVDAPPNPAVDEGRAHSLLFTARWSWKEPLFASEGSEREAWLARSSFGTAFRREQVLRVEASYEKADADALGGDFTFDRFIARSSAAHRLSPTLWLFGTATGGRGGTLPRQHRFRLGGQGTLRGREFDALEGDRMVAFTAELLYEPAGRWPAVIPFYDGGTAWAAGTPRPAWRHDAGLGLAWPASSSRLVRVDFALPLNENGDERKLRVTGYVRLPF
jgi:hypothetical protein